MYTHNFGWVVYPLPVPVLGSNVPRNEVVFWDEGKEPSTTHTVSWVSSLHPNVLHAFTWNCVVIFKTECLSYYKMVDGCFFYIISLVKKVRKLQILGLALSWVNRQRQSNDEDAEWGKKTPLPYSTLVKTTSSTCNNCVLSISRWPILTYQSPHPLSLHGPVDTFWGLGCPPPQTFAGLPGSTHSQHLWEGQFMMESIKTSWGNVVMKMNQQWMTGICGEWWQDDWLTMWLEKNSTALQQLRPV